MKTNKKNLLDEYKNFVIFNAAISEGICDNVIESPINPNNYWSSLGGQNPVGWNNMNSFKNTIQSVETEWKSNEDDYRLDWTKSLYDTIISQETINTNVKKIKTKVLLPNKERIISSNMEKLCKNKKKTILKNVSSFLSWEKIK